MHKFGFFILIVGILSLCACVTEKLRTPAQTLQAEPVIKRNFISLSSYVKVPGPDLSKSELRPYQDQCHVQMVEKLLDFNKCLREIKNYRDRNIQVSRLHLTKLLKSVTAVDLKYISWYFEFTVEDSNRKKYNGHIYTYTVLGQPLIKTHDDGKTYEYDCWQDHNGWILDAAILTNHRGNIVFSSSKAQEMLNENKNVDERCEEL